MKTLAQWLADNPLAPIEIDCVVTVMLKILDGKCKMAADEKTVMAALYQATKRQVGKLLPAGLHELIAQAEASQSETLTLEIYEQRLLAETMLSRPVMKQFKARIRSAGLFAVINDTSLAGV